MYDDTKEEIGIWLIIFTYGLIIIGLGYLNNYLPSPYNVFYAYSEYVFWVIIFLVISFFIGFLYAIFSDDYDYYFYDMFYVFIVLSLIAGAIILFLGWNNLNLSTTYNASLFFFTSIGLFLGSRLILSVLLRSPVYTNNNSTQSNNTTQVSHSQNSSSESNFDQPKTTYSAKTNIALLISVLKTGTYVETEAASKALREIAEGNLYSLINYFKDISECIRFGYSKTLKNLFYILMKGAMYSAISVIPYVDKIAEGLENEDDEIVQLVIETLYYITLSSPEVVRPYLNSIINQKEKSPYASSIAVYLSQHPPDKQKIQGNATKSKSNKEPKKNYSGSDQNSLIEGLTHGDIMDKIQCATNLAKISDEDPESMIGNLKTLSAFLDFSNEAVSNKIAHIFNKISYASPESVSNYTEKLIKSLRKGSPEGKTLLTDAISNISNVNEDLVALELSSLIPMLNDPEDNVKKNVSGIILNLWKKYPNSIEPYVEDLKQYGKKNSDIMVIINSFNRNNDKSGTKTQENNKVPENKSKNSSFNNANYRDVSDTDTGIVGISGAGKTVFLSLLDLYMSNHEREMKLKWEVAGDIPTLRSHQKMILSGEFPEGTVSGARERYSFKITDKIKNTSFSSTITDIPGEEVMGPDIADSAYNVDKFINYLTENNLSYLLNCKSLIFIIPAKNLISEKESPNALQWNLRNPKEVSFAYRDFFNNLMKAREESMQEQKGGIKHRLSRKNNNTPVLILVSQWDIVRAVVKSDTTEEEFISQRMKEFYNSFTDLADEGKISYNIMGVSIQTTTVQTEGITTFRPALQDGNPQYMGIHDIIDWIIKTNNGGN